MRREPPGRMHMRFWGVRGSVAVPGYDTAQYGGNTACVELRCGDHLVILDAGTGIRSLGQELVSRDQPVDADILCSHTHLDHIGGLAYFAPAYLPHTRLRLWAGHLSAPQTLEAVVNSVLNYPLNPDLRAQMSADLTFTDFPEGGVFMLGDAVRVTTAPLRHPGGATGFRIDWAGRSMAYVTDTEHPADGPDPNVVRLAASADYLIFDASYTDAEYPAHVGWGHSTWQEGIRAAEAAAARHLILFHHNATRGDAALMEIAEQAERARPGTLVAREGMELTW